MTPMHNPPHPGEIVREECLEPLGLTVTRAAQGLGVTRQALSDLVNGKAGVSVEMSIRLSKAFGSSPETWLGMQTAYDLWRAQERADGIEVERFTTRSEDVADPHRRDYRTNGQLVRRPEAHASTRIRPWGLSPPPPIFEAWLG